jgi:hypothetical protein
MAECLNLQKLVENRLLYFYSNNNSYCNIRPHLDHFQSIYCKFFNIAFANYCVYQGKQLCSIILKSYKKKNFRRKKAILYSMSYSRISGSLRYRRHFLRIKRRFKSRIRNFSREGISIFHKKGGKVNRYSYYRNKSTNRK